MDRSRMAAALAAGLLLQFGLAQAQVQPTIESAQAFLKEVLTKGTSGVALDEIDADGEATGEFEWAQITSVSGAGCATRIGLSSRHGPRSRSVNWASVSNVDASGSLTDPFGQLRYPVILEGAIRDSAGKTISEMSLGADSVPMRDRVSKAMDFLREKCDATSRFGF